MTEKISGIAGNSRNARESGTKVRQETKGNLDLIPRIITLVILLALFVLLLTSDLSLFWRLVSSAILFGIGSKTASMQDKKKESLWHFPIILKAMGLLIFAISIGTSGIVKKADQLVTYADTCLQSECPDTGNTPMPNSSGVAPSYTNSMLGDLPLMTVRPGEKGPEVFRPKGSCTTVTHVRGSDDYVIYSRTTEGRIVQGGGDGKATASWIVVPRNAGAPATVQFTRHRC